MSQRTTPAATAALPPTTMPTISPTFAVVFASRVGPEGVGVGVWDGIGGVAVGDCREVVESFRPRFIALIKALRAIVWLIPENVVLGGPGQEPA